MDYRIADAVEEGDADEVRRLVREEGVDPFATEKHGKTILHIACQGGRITVVEYLIEDVQADLEATDNWGCTALHWACSHGNDQLSVVNYLVETRGANVEARTSGGETPLHVASIMGNARVVQYLVEQGRASANAKDLRGRTPLDRSVRIGFGNERVARSLLPRMTSIDDEKTLAFIWKRGYSQETQRMFLEKYASGRGLSNAFRRTPIHILLSQFPLHSAKAFQDSIELFPASNMSLLDTEGRLAIHVALTSHNAAVKSPTVIGFLFEREPRSALARDPMTGLYPHETAAVGLVSTNHRSDVSWLDVTYKVFRSNPQHFLHTREDRTKVNR